MKRTSILHLIQKAQADCFKDAFGIAESPQPCRLSDKKIVQATIAMLKTNARGGRTKKRPVNSVNPVKK